MSDPLFDVRSWIKFLLWRTKKIWASAQSKEAWDQEYAGGHWKGLESMQELGHYSAIAGYADFSEAKAILDVGCGHGVLARRLTRLGYQNYLGIDLSAEAIKEASSLNQDPRSTFAAADAWQFETEQAFDLIIFNECLYYLGEPRKIMRKYSKFLAPNGKFIVSMFGVPANLAIWHELQQELRVMDSVSVRHGSGYRWTVKLLSRDAAAPCAS